MRQPHSRRAEIRLEHEGEPGTAGRCEGAPAGERRALQHREHGVFALGVDDLRIHFAVGDQFGEMFDEARLRRDRIDRNHVRPDHGDAESRRLVALADDMARLVGRRAVVFQDRCAHSAVSVTMTIARCGHSVAQMPQPLHVRRSISNQAGRSTTHCTGQ